MYPIGLITADEMALAGLAYNSMNRMSYVYSDQHYWTMSPSLFNGYTAALGLFGLLDTGLIYDNIIASLNIMVRPVISISKDVEITGGIGTSSDPFVVAIS